MTLRKRDGRCLSKPLACHIELINTTLSSCSIQIESRLKTYVWSSRVIYTLLNLTWILNRVCFYLKNIREYLKYLHFNYVWKVINYKIPNIMFILHYQIQIEFKLTQIDLGLLKKIIYVTGVRFWSEWIGFQSKAIGLSFQWTVLLD